MLSIDVQPSTDINDPRIEFLGGDAARLDERLSLTGLRGSRIPG